MLRCSLCCSASRPVSAFFFRGVVACGEVVTLAAGVRRPGFWTTFRRHQGTEKANQNEDLAFRLVPASWPGAAALNMFRAPLATFLLGPVTPCCADPAPVIHYALAENLEHVDVALIDRAEHEIDLAAYVLTDWPVMQALTRAADRGVKVRVYLQSRPNSSADLE